MVSPMMFLSVCLFVLFALGEAQGSAKLCPAVRKCIRRLDSGEKCNVLPVPVRARLDPLPNGESTEVRLLRKGVWLYRTLAYNSLIVHRKRVLVVIDMPDSMGSNTADGSRTQLTDAVLKVLDGEKPRRIYMVYTHGHFDHIGGSRRFHQWARRVYPKARIDIIGSSDIPKMIRESVSKRAVMPNRIIHDRACITLHKSLKLKMRVLPGHREKNLAIHIPRFGGEKGILFFVDVVFPKWAPFELLGFTTNVGSYISVHDQLMEYDFDIFVGGHMNIGNHEDIAESLRFVKDLMLAAEQGSKAVTRKDLGELNAGNFGVPGTPQYGNLWFAFLTAGRRLQAKKCARIMIEKWGCQLGGVATTAESHCFTALSYVVLSQ